MTAVSHRSSSNPSPYLMLLWCSCYCLGTVAALQSRETLLSLLPKTLAVQRSAYCMTIPAVLPFLVSCLAVYSNMPKLLYLICSWKAFCFAFCSAGLVFLFDSGSWLGRLLFLFTDVMTIPLLYFYWLRHISGQRRFTLVEVFSLWIYLLFISGIDYCLISPFAAKLIIH